ncbi:MAG: FG-GAP-like repeat-containing protein, partial [Planctomycetota bacterium]
MRGRSSRGAARNPAHARTRRAGCEIGPVPSGVPAIGRRASLRLLPLALLLLAAPAPAGGKREVPAILADHADAVGPVRSVRTIRAVSTLDNTTQQIGDVVTHRRLPRECLREFPSGRREYLSEEGAFVLDGFFERYRPGQRGTRAGHYLFVALADLFPLLPYLDDSAAAAALQPASAEGQEGLLAPEDAHGVRALYLLDAKSHLLSNVRFLDARGRALVNVVYEDWRRVGDVRLPHRIWASAALEREDADAKGFVSSMTTRIERVASYELGAAPPASFSPAGRGEEESRSLRRRSFPTGPDPASAEAADLDGDGECDFAAGCEGGVYVHFGGAEGTPVRVPLGEGRHPGLAVDDLDCDGRNELIVSSNVRPAHTFFVVSFGRDRVASVRRLFTATHVCGDLRSHDLDGDGLPDLLASGWASRSLEIRFGNGVGASRGAGTLWPLDAERKGRRGYGLSVGNVDRDGLWDVALADGQDVVLFRGEPNLAFLPAARLAAGPRPVQAAFADLNGDGLDDLLVVNEHPVEDLPGDLKVLLNTGSSFKIHAQLDAGARVPSLAVGDVDGDANVDAVTASFLTGEVRIFFGDGKGGFPREERCASGRGTCRVVVLDANGDGRDDIVAADRLDDTISVFLNAGKFPGRPRRAPPRARACGPPVKEEFVLEGLSCRYRFEGEFRLPVEITDPSGIAFFSGDPNHSRFFVVSDDESSLFRVTLDRAGGRLLVGPPVPLRGPPGLPERLDLEAVAVDHDTGTLFLASEADSHVLWVTAFGRVLGRAPSGVDSGDNDGLEALAFRRKKDGTPLLYLFRERMGTSMKQPPVLVAVPGGDPFALKPRLATKVPGPLLDQSDAVCDGESIFVVSRLSREVLELGLSGDDFAPTVRRASYRKLTDELLGLVDARMPLFGTVEGIARDGMGDLFLLVDNNGAEVGVPGKNRGKEGRLLWLSAFDPPPGTPHPAAVLLEQILVPFAGARASSSARTREEAEGLAVDLERRARAGEELAALRARVAGEGASFPARLRV